jgi:long-chain acyl-CoA synthetase
MNVETLSELLHVNVTRYNKPDLLMYRGRGGVLYNISSNEFKDLVVHFALGLKRLGVKPETKVSLLSENRPEWHIADFACHLLGAIVVPIFSTLIAEQIEYIIQNSDSEFVIVSNQNQLTKIQQIRRRLKKAKRVITMEGGQDRTVAFQQVLETGREQDDADFF